MSVRIAINGFGRIGRNVLRAIVEADRHEVEVVAINDLAPVETNAHLLRFDSVLGESKAGRSRRKIGVLGPEDSYSVDKLSLGTLHQRVARRRFWTYRLRAPRLHVAGLSIPTSQGLRP